MMLIERAVSGRLFRLRNPTTGNDRSPPVTRRDRDMIRISMSTDGLTESRPLIQSAFSWADVECLNILIACSLRRLTNNISLVCKRHTYLEDLMRWRLRMLQTPVPRLADDPVSDARYGRPLVSFLSRCRLQVAPVVSFYCQRSRHVWNNLVDMRRRIEDSKRESANLLPRRRILPWPHRPRRHRHHRRPEMKRQSLDCRKMTSPTRQTWMWNCPLCQ